MQSDLKTNLGKLNLAVRRAAAYAEDKLGQVGIIKLILILILVVFLMLVYQSARAEDVPVDTIEQALRKETDIESMEKCGNRQLMQFIGLDHSQYDGYIYYRTREALGVDELLIVKAQEREDLPQVEDMVEQRIKDQMVTFDSYGPSQVRLLKNAVIYKKGNYLFYCVGKDPDRYEEVLKHAV